MKTINVIRHLGEPNKATTLDGKIVERQETLFMSTMSLVVKAEHYDDHFVYRNTVVNTPTWMCTCGSAAAVTPLPANVGGRYVVTPNTRMRCLYYMNHGKHVTTDVQRVQYER